MSSKILIVDIETAGTSGRIDYANDIIVEVGIVGLNLETGEKKKLMDTLVNQGITEDHRNSWVFKKTDIKFEDVLKAPKLDTEGIQFLLDNYSATAYNKSFDFSFFKKNTLKVNELSCPMRLLTPIIKLPFPSGRSGYKWPSAQEAYDFLFPDNDYTETHRACDDAWHEADIVLEMYKRGEFDVK